METIQKLETTLAAWYKQVPFHFPENVRRWIVRNVWWIVLIGVILSALTVIAAARTAFYVDQLTVQYGALANYYGVQTVNSSMNNVALWTGLGFSAAVLVVEALAIQPLKARNKRGWDLLFLGMLISALSAVVTAVLYVNAFSLIGSAISLAIGGYFLFEIHSQYTKNSKKVKAK